MTRMNEARKRIAGWEAMPANAKARELRNELAAAAMLGSVLVDEIEHLRAALLSQGKDVPEPSEPVEQEDKPGKVRTWRCYGHVHGSKYLGEVQARSAKEAQEKAFEELAECHVRFCHQCTSECEDPEIDEINVETDNA